MKFNTSNSSWIFLRKFVTLLLLWKSLFFAIWRIPFLLDAYNNFSIKVIGILLSITHQLLLLLNYSSTIISSTRIIMIEGTSGVTVGEPCIGFDLMALVIGLILSTQLNIKSKIKNIAIGLALVNSLNIIRIAALAILVQYDPYLWELNHKFIFTSVVYIFIFIFWIKISKKGFTQTSFEELA